MPQQQQSVTQMLRQRSISNNGYSKKLQTSHDTMERLNLEKCFNAHKGCVNCLEWNKSGKLLASGSDDHSIIIYDPFVQTKTNDNIHHSIDTDHQGNIFSIKFMPGSGDALMATGGGDNHVKLINIYSGENLLDCKHCHQERVKRLAIHHREPNLIWSSGEDGLIMEYDIREVHNCSLSRQKNLILDLKTASPTSPVAKCLAINPIRDEMIAIGSTDSYIRLFDRRFMRKQGWNSCTAYFTPGQFLLKSRTNEKKTNPIQFSYASPISTGTTYVAFSPNGSELLANIHAEQIYLFDTYEPFESFKTFQHTLEPLILDLPKKTQVNKYYNINPIAHWNKLRQSDKRLPIPNEFNDFYNEMMQKCRRKEILKKEEFDRINTMLSKMIYCPEFYHLRAAALIQRAWKGDYYQSIRDSCSCLALNPLDCISYENLAYSAYYLHDKDLAISLLSMIKLFREELTESEPNYNLDQATKVLQSISRDSPTGSPLIWSSNGSPHCPPHDIQIIEPTFRGRYNPYVVDIYDSSVRSAFFNSIADSEIQLIDSTNSKEFKSKEALRSETKRIANAFDYSKRFCGHCNLHTDIKEANFFGHDGDFIVAGSDDGAFYIWDKQTTNIVKAVAGDHQILNCIQPHPSICMLATSGVESTVKIWSPIGRINCDIKCLEKRCNQNQDFITSDPLEAMMMMLQPSRAQEEQN